MDETELTEEPQRPKRRWGRRIIVALSVLVVVIGLPLLLLSLVGATFTTPVWLSERVETEIAKRMGGGRLDLGPTEVVFERRLNPHIRIRNVGVFDQNGAEVARLNQITVQVAPGALLRGQVNLESLTLSGAQVTIRRGADGVFSLNFGGGTGASGDLAGVIDAMDEVFANGPLATLRSLRAEEVTITLEDARTARLWQVTDGKVFVRNLEGSVETTIAADVFNGTEDLASTVIGFTSDKSAPNATLTATFENAAAQDIAAQSPALAFLEVLDAPISGSLGTSLDKNGAIAGLAGSLNIGQGALQPSPDTPPIQFDFGQAYVEYDPDVQALSFSQVAFQSETASVSAQGTAFLQDFQGRWPEAMVGQFAISDMRLQPEGIFAQPMAFDRGAIDFRLRLDPFTLDIGQVSLGPSEQRVLARGQVRADDNGWIIALDLGLNSMALDRILEIWPVTVARGARAWVERNVLGGEVSDLAGAFRFATGQKPRVSLNFLFDQARIQALHFIPALEDVAGYASLDQTSFTLVTEKGHVPAGKGGDANISGSVFHIPDLTGDVDRAEITLNTESSITAALTLLNSAPLSLMDKAGLSTELAQGRVLANSDISFDLVKEVEFDDVSYSVVGELRSVASDVLVKNRSLTARNLSLAADRAGVEIKGPAQIDGLDVTGAWSQKFGPEQAGKSTVEGTIELSQSFLDAFNIALPPGSLEGRGIANIKLDLADDAPPKFALTSDLNRLGLRLSALNWSKPRNRTGRLEIAGQLGDVPSIDRLSLEAPGLSASGVIDLSESGGLERAQFDRVRVGTWLDGPVSLQGRGPSRPPAVAVRGGRVDMRTAELGSGDGEGGGPLSMQLDRLTITEGIALTNFEGEFKEGKGLDGRFTGRVNGGAPIQGNVVPTPAGAAVRITGNNAGATLADAGVLRNLRSGALDLTLNPAGGAGIYNGRLNIKNTRVAEAPAMTELLNAISIVGLLDQMNAGGILLSDVEAEFQLSPDRLILLGSSAVGPSLGISLDGIYDLNADVLDMQGVVSPVYFLNGIGQLFSRGREGLFGFAFRLKGASEDPKVFVNPLSILTPGAFREIFRRPPPEPVRSQ